MPFVPTDGLQPQQMPAAPEMTIVTARWRWREKRQSCIAACHRVSNMQPAIGPPPAVTTAVSGRC